MANNERLETYLGVKADRYSVHKCKQCGATFKHHHSEIWYQIENKKFCSYNCKCKYEKEHEEKVFSTKKLIISHIVESKSFEKLAELLKKDLNGLYDYRAKEGIKYNGKTKAGCKKSKYEKYHF